MAVLFENSLNLQNILNSMFIKGRGIPLSNRMKKKTTELKQNRKTSLGGSQKSVKESVKYIQKDCTDEEVKYIDILLKILRSDDEKPKRALKIMMNQILRKC